jgi:hypothetical protein
MSNISPDGSALFASEVLSINSESYVAESLDVSFPVDVVTLQDENGNDNNNVYISRSVEGSATIQIGTSQAIPQRGDSFALTVDSTSYTFLITESSISRSNSDFAKVSISFRERLNTPSA